MLQLRKAKEEELAGAMRIIQMAKEHLKAQGIDQWQNGYPDEARIARDIAEGKGYFLTEDDIISGYLCIDYDGEPAYENLNGEWATAGPYVVVHRMAFSDKARGKGLADAAFRLVEKQSAGKGIRSFRVDTDEDNKKMRHILEKNGFVYRGTIWFDNSVKIAFDKKIYLQEAF